MPQVERSRASFRVIGDDLVPDEISRLLGGSPTHAHTNGERWIGKTTGNTYVRDCGMWRLEAECREPADLDQQIEEILSQLTDDLMIWKSLGERYSLDLFCGIFMGGSNEWLTISPESQVALGSRGIELNLDIYGGSDADDD